MGDAMPGGRGDFLKVAKKIVEEVVSAESYKLPESVQLAIVDGLMRAFEKAVEPDCYKLTFDSVYDEDEEEDDKS